MSSQEEYLDNLLQSVIGGQKKEPEEVLKEVSGEKTADFLADLSDEVTSAPDGAGQPEPETAEPEIMDMEPEIGDWEPTETAEPEAMDLEPEPEIGDWEPAETAEPEILDLESKPGDAKPEIPAQAEESLGEDLLSEVLSETALGTETEDIPLPEELLAGLAEDLNADGGAELENDTREPEITEDASDDNDFFEEDLLTEVLAENNGEIDSLQNRFPDVPEEEIVSDDRFQEDALSGEELLAQMLEEEPLPENILPEGDNAGTYREDAAVGTQPVEDAGFGDLVSVGEADDAEWDAAEFDRIAAELAGSYEESEKPVPEAEIPGGDAVEEAAKEDVFSDRSGAPDLDTVSAMSEEEIEKLLQASGEAPATESEKTDSEGYDDSFGDDLSGMLKDTDDGDLMEIQDMLEKADNNVAVNEEIEALLNGADGEETPDMDRVLDPKDEKRRQAEERKRLRREKAAARKAEKAAAKEAKAAAKAAAREGKKAGASEGMVAPGGQTDAEKPDRSEESGLTAEESKRDEEEGLFDADLLDAIVSEAELADRDETTAPDDAAATESDGAAYEELDQTAEPTSNETAVPDAAAGGADDGESDSFGFDMNSLFDDVDDSSLGAEGGTDSAFPDFVDIDGDNVDDLIPELKETERKKKGLLSRLFEMLTEEDEEENNEDIRLSNENRDILNDLDNEKKSGKKKKKKGKKADIPEDGEEDDKKAKAKKGKKAKKPKPEKPKKEPAPGPLIPEKKLSPKKVLPIFAVCASLGVLIVVFTNASVDFRDKQTARDAYYAEDYQTCYQNLFGKDLNETEQIMFGTSKSILYIRLWLSEYEMFLEAGEEVEALDSLIQTVAQYPALYDYAVQWNAGDEVAVGYAAILNILSEKYGLTEAQAREIAAVKSNYKYTQMVVDIVQGKPFGSWDASAPVLDEPQQAPDVMEDELPEESELTDGSFIDGGTN